jgi:hypothetical protein
VRGLPRSGAHRREHAHSRRGIAPLHRDDPGGPRCRSERPRHPQRRVAPVTQPGPRPPSRSRTSLLARAQARGWAGRIPTMASRAPSARSCGRWDRCPGSRSANPSSLAPRARGGHAARDRESQGARVVPRRCGASSSRQPRGRRAGGGDRLARHRGRERSRWGYPFGWQSRHFWAPPHLPNAVVTSTVAWHLFEYADRHGSSRAQSMALARARFLATALSRSDAPGGEAIAYTRRTIPR